MDPCKQLITAEGKGGGNKSSVFIVIWDRKMFQLYINQVLSRILKISLETGRGYSKPRRIQVAGCLSALLHLCSTYASCRHLFITWAVKEMWTISCLGKIGINTVQIDGEVSLMALQTPLIPCLPLGAVCKTLNSYNLHVASLVTHMLLLY